MTSLMSQFSHLPPELLSRIVDFVAVPHGDYAENKRPSNTDPGRRPKNEATFRGLSYANIALATSPAPDSQSLQSLRLVSSVFKDLSTPLLFAVVRVLPSDASAERYRNILQSEELNLHVRKVVFQTRLQPDARLFDYTSARRPEEDEYGTPLPSVLAAMQVASSFKNLIHAQLIMYTECVSPEDWMRGGPEGADFRFTVLSTFYSGLVQADKLTNLTLKNLQNVTPRALMGKATTPEEISFKQDFDTVMSKIKQLSLGITTEDCFASPENTLTIPELHDFFGFELQEYWLAPFAANLEYLKLYGNREVYWGFYPACNLPHFPVLKTLILGYVSFASEHQMQWLLSHANTLEELILDNAILGIAVETGEIEVDVTNQKVVYERDYSKNPPGYQPKPRSHLFKTETWLDSTRWHHLFRRFQEELPKLRHFAINHNTWDDLVFEHADALNTAMKETRYAVFTRHCWSDFWNYDADDFVLKEYEEDENDRIQIEKPDCDEEDWEALNELFADLMKRR
jgi:hypothetical protein